MKNVVFIQMLVLLLCWGCKSKVDTKKPTSVYESQSTSTFSVRFGDDDRTRQLMEQNVLFGNDAHVKITTIEGLGALEVQTISEFSDAFIDLEKLFGHTIDFESANYMTLKLFVPKQSWITALKINFKDANGNFGGIHEVTNNFYGHYDQWIEVAVDLKKLLPGFENWHGEKSPLGNTSQVSLNPYNAHQADSSSIYIHSIRLLDALPDTQEYVPALAQLPRISPNIPYTMTFDDENVLKKQMAIRAFESSYQAMSKNIAGNGTMAVRLKGSPANKYIAFLPIFDKLTGAPVDFTKVKRIFFSYYLTEDSADFDGSQLFLASEKWKDVLLDENVFSDFRKGEWTNVSLTIADMDLQLVRGDKPVMPNVYELRLDLNYRPEQKNIEMWIDNFGWE